MLIVIFQVILIDRKARLVYDPVTEIPLVQKEQPHLNDKVPHPHDEYIR